MSTNPKLNSIIQGYIRSILQERTYREILPDNREYFLNVYLKAILNKTEPIVIESQYEELLYKVYKIVRIKSAINIIRSELRDLTKKYNIHQILSNLILYNNSLNRIFKEFNFKPTDEIIFREIKWKIESIQNELQELHDSRQMVEISHQIQQFKKDFPISNNKQSKFTEINKYKTNLENNKGIIMFRDTGKKYIDFTINELNVYLNSIKSQTSKIRSSPYANIGRGDYSQKYLKYKTKYLELKKSILKN